MASAVQRNAEFFGEPREDPVEVVPYDPAWPERFEKYAGRLRKSLGPVARSIDHVGSTSVVGLAAKPTIDIQVGVFDLEDEGAYRPKIESLGLLLRYRMAERRFFQPPKGKPRNVHVHVVEFGVENGRERLLFAAYLRAYPKRRDAYAALKEELAKRFPDDRVRYTDGKDDFIRETLRLAKRWAEEKVRRADKT